MKNSQEKKEALKEERINKLKELTSQAMNYRYLIQDQLTDAITAGNEQQLEETLDLIDTEKVLNNLGADNEADLIEKLKSHLVTVNTYARIAAKNGGVLPLYLHLIYERFSMIIDDADSVDYLVKHVYFEIYREYCHSVVHFSSSGYSAVMKEIVSYITENLTGELTLTNIASIYGMHPVHLARKFKQETGNTFIGYVNQQRVYLAKYYFHLGEHQLSEVANLAGFNSHSYFTKVFKKITGKTPTKYLKELPECEKV
ncbi:Transcriptional regulator, AraC family [Alkalibacterium sp. AK22]|uniref:AraC family transcriptional regulator n=1 Tax=Alkalibacterium sp. AK22 TaxID=1229520 RepID=UPI000446C425|nr:AraC family transcriptional regulator [Alkalibacterium sp. AK22]EXJ22632.1 Transcriptional regulator, AraC family [Alkalibacterium sp. AK22]